MAWCSAMPSASRPLELLRTLLEEETDARLLGASPLDVLG